MNTRLLKSKRVLRNLKQYEVADKIGLSKKAYNHKENGKSQFTVDEVCRLINCLELTLNECNEVFFSDQLPKGKI